MSLGSCHSLVKFSQLSIGFIRDAKFALTQSNADWIFDWPVYVRRMTLSLARKPRGTASTRRDVYQRLSVHSLKTNAN